VADLSNLVLVGYFDTPGTSLDVFVSGNYAYLADGDEGLQVVDIANPSNPVLIGSCLTIGYAYDVCISGMYAYIPNGSSGVEVINISDPVNPFSAGSYNTSGWATNIAADINYIYVADNYAMLILGFTPTGIEESNNLPIDYNQLSNYPNPFNGSTLIKYYKSSGEAANIDIFDILGRKLLSQSIEELASENGTFLWDGRDKLGLPVASGVYFYRFTAGEKSLTRQMTIIR
jgi:hypothetical protein